MNKKPDNIVPISRGRDIKIKKGKIKLSDEENIIDLQKKKEELEKKKEEADRSANYKGFALIEDDLEKLEQKIQKLERKEKERKNAVRRIKELEDKRDKMEMEVLELKGKIEKEEGVEKTILTSKMGEKRAEIEEIKLQINSLEKKLDKK